MVYAVGVQNKFVHGGGAWRTEIFLLLFFTFYDFYHISSENFRAIFFLEFWHFSEIIILLMFIQFSGGVLQLKFVSGKQENGSKFSNTLQIDIEPSYSRFYTLEQFYTYANAPYFSLCLHPNEVVNEAECYLKGAGFRDSRFEA
jgi:hypothetical protein